MFVARGLMVGSVLLASATGCSSTPPPNPYVGCSNGDYILDDPTVTPGGFDSASCVQFMKSIPNIQTDPTKAPELITPLAGALLPATPIATFAWSPGQLAMTAGDGGGDVDAGDAGSTLTGDAYVLIFNAAAATADGGITELLRVMTINTTFTPTAAQWMTLQATGSIEASVYGMYFADGTITDGPYTAPQARAFSISQ
jgi:hypothetical protein